ncbi:MAG: preprotein translocase subunit SecY [Armatimonadetes bacterium]|nr:preprotein translocase subunit SecY [Armatimonadota bacterium]
MGLNAFASAARLRDIRNRLLWVFGLFAVFVLMVHIPVPGIDLNTWNQLLAKGGDLINFLGMFTGGALNKFSIGAMGITPYINASIIMQLLTHVIPKLHDLQKEGGELGRRQIAQYVRYGTMGLAIMQATIMSLNLSRFGVFYNNNWQQIVLTVLALTAGTAFLMWLGEQLTDKGIGNGVSLIIFAGIVLAYPSYVSNVLATANVAGPAYWFSIGIFMVLFVLLVAGIVALTQGQRKIPVQYAKRQVGRRVYGGQNTYIPIRVNNAGVISIIFAISIMYLPGTFIRAFNPNPLPGTWTFSVLQFFSADSVFFNLTYALLVIFFTYFYAGIQFNPIDVADNMKKYGGFIPGIRPGRPTGEYLEKILNRVTFVAAIALALIAVVPTYIIMLTGVQFYLGSTSLLIIVGVALDTMQQIEARLVMRNYQGFMK